MTTTTPSSTFPPFRMAPPVTDPATHTLSGVLRNAWRLTVAMASGNPIIFRQEVPIECWLRDHGLLEPIKGPKDELRARGYAVLATLEGFVRILAETISLFYSSYISKKSSDAERHQLVFKTQMKSLQLSAMAIISPNSVKEHIKTTCTNEDTLVFCRQSKMRWGTEYYGKRTIPATSLECSSYPWYT